MSVFVLLWHINNNGLHLLHAKLIRLNNTGLIKAYLSDKAKTLCVYWWTKNRGCHSKTVIGLGLRQIRPLSPS